MTSSESTWQEDDCYCECHDDGGCPTKISVRVHTPMSAELIKLSYLQLEVGSDEGRDEFTNAPILNRLDSLFPLLTNAGLYEWATYVFSNLGRWEPEVGTSEWISFLTHRKAALDRYSTEIDNRFEVPDLNPKKNKERVRGILAKRDGLGCVCRRGPMECGYPFDGPSRLGQYEIGHLHPQALGGSDKWSNLALMNPACNRSQGPKMFHQWLEEQTGRRHEEALYWSAQGPKSHNEGDLIAAVGRRWKPAPRSLFDDIQDTQ